MLNFLRLLKRHPLLAISALCAVVATRLALWSLPFRWLHRWSESASQRHSTGVLMRRLRIAQAVHISSRLVPAASCLTQAHAAQWLLYFRGETALLRLGAARGKAGGIEAHAWLEHDGGVLLGHLPDLARYQPFRQARHAS